MNANYWTEAEAAGSHHNLGSRSRTGYVEKALKDVKIHGKRFSAYLDTGREALDAENYHHFYSTKRSPEEEHEIPVIVKVDFLAERMGHGTEFIPNI